MRAAKNRITNDDEDDNDDDERNSNTIYATQDLCWGINLTRYVVINAILSINNSLSLTHPRFRGSAAPRGDNNRDLPNPAAKKGNFACVLCGVWAVCMSVVFPLLSPIVRVFFLNSLYTLKKYL